MHSKCVWDICEICLDLGCSSKISHYVSASIPPTENIQTGNTPSATHFKGKKISQPGLMLQIFLHRRAGRRAWRQAHVFLSSSGPQRYWLIPKGPGNCKIRMVVQPCWTRSSIETATCVLIILKRCPRKAKRKAWQFDVSIPPLHPHTQADPPALVCTLPRRAGSACPRSPPGGRTRPEPSACTSGEQPRERILLTRAGCSSTRSKRLKATHSISPIRLGKVIMSHPPLTHTVHCNRPI